MTRNILFGITTLYNLNNFAFSFYAIFRTNKVTICDIDRGNTAKFERRLSYERL